jgi:hypothetical protein
MSSDIAEVNATHRDPLHGWRGSVSAHGFRGIVFAYLRFVHRIGYTTAHDMDHHLDIVLHLCRASQLDDMLGHIIG